MNPKLIVIAIMATLLTFPAYARHHHSRHHHYTSIAARGHQGCDYDNSGHQLCLGVVSADIGHPRGSSHCPINLGCGCNLANYFHIGGQQWRDLWVARNWAKVGSPASHGCVGCVVVLSRGRGGHVGVVRGYDANGNPTVYSYANGRLGWTTATYSSRRVLAYRSI